jgi:transcription initiation factor IIF auxiliary subunit
MRIAQSEKYQGDDWWEWAVWIDGKPAEINSIQSVTYTLHPSFRNPIRTVTNRQSKFRLQSEGWGGFTIAARVESDDGNALLLKHVLELYYPEAGPVAKRSKSRKSSK